MLKINEWWKDYPSECFWLEITWRLDIGADLKAPQFAGDGERETYSYTLLKYVSVGDIVFHYSTRHSSIIGYSIVDSEYFEDDIKWKALGTSALKDEREAYIRPGFKVGLRNFTEFSDPISLNNLRAYSSNILSIKNKMEKTHKGGLYFPFSFDKEILVKGAVQGYLVKFPESIVSLFDQMQSAPIKQKNLAKIEAINLGTKYRKADENTASSKRKPFDVDPDVVDRGTNAHARIQNSIAETLVENGIKPESPGNQSINFDVAWRFGSKHYLAEVKSTTVDNFEKQLRLGLGQILRYSSLILEENEAEIAPILVVEKILDESWYATCSNVGVTLVAEKDIAKFIQSIIS